MDVINFISLHYREDRLISLCNEAKQQKFAMRLWEGVEGNLQPSQNINQAHRRIIQWAKDNNQERCIIGEDDIRFTAPGAWHYFLTHIPESYDIFFSMLYAAEIKENKVVNGFSGLTLYVVHNRFYDFFLSTPDNVHLDRHLGQFCHEKEFYVCQPYIARQSGGFSNNLLMNMTYGEIEKNMTFFEGND